MKITIIMVLALAIAALMRRQPAALRHWILACAVVCASATPIVSQLLPAWPIGLAPLAPAAIVDVSRPFRDAVNPSSDPGRGGANDGFRDAGPTATDAAAPPLAWWLAAVWIAGAAVGIAGIVIGLARLSWLASRSRPITTGLWRELTDQIAVEWRLPRRVVLLRSEHPSLLVTWGTRWPKIILPDAALTWPRERIRIVLRHELAHVQRSDWAIQVAAELLKAAYWFNPVIWVVGRRLRLESEQACDDAVVNSGIEGSDYAAHLVELARALNQQPRTWLPAPAIARPSSLHRRVSAMLNTDLDRRPISRSRRGAIAAVLLTATVAIAAAQAPFATVSGTVADSKGGFIPGATLTLSHAVSQVKHEVKTDPTGRFELVGLSAGEYVLETKYIGFAILRDTFSLSAGQTMSRNIMLQVGTLQETITVIDSDQPAAAVAYRRAGPPPVKAPCVAGSGGIGGNIKAPLKLVDVKPIYPVNLRPSRAAGRVEMEATIGTDGTVTSTNVVASPQPDMSAAAVEAVRQWQFSSTLLNCAPVEVQMNVLVTFQPQP